MVFRIPYTGCETQYPGKPSALFGQSDYQRIDIFETPEFGRVLTPDGNVMLTERDEFIYDEMITHVPMAIHKEAKRDYGDWSRRWRCRS